MQTNMTVLVVGPPFDADRFGEAVLVFAERIADTSGHPVAAAVQHELTDRVAIVFVVSPDLAVYRCDESHELTLALRMAEL